jgi:outer membrane protein OmpA-like peptidoglycan-associated protein
MLCVVSGAGVAAFGPTSWALAQTSVNDTADALPSVEAIEEALAPRKRRGPGAVANQRSKPAEALDWFEDLRRRRGPTMQDRAQLYRSLESAPQIDLTVYFEFDSAEIGPQAYEALHRLGTALKSARLGSGRIVIAGHTDAKGTAAYNLALSDRRAEAVRNHLVSAMAVAPERLLAIGYGLEQLADPKNPLSGRNRRVQVVNVE